MDFKSLEKFESALQTHTGNVRRIYDRLLKSESAGGARPDLPPEFDGAEAEWEAIAGGAFLPRAGGRVSGVQGICRRAGRCACLAAHGRTGAGIDSEISGVVPKPEGRRQRQKAETEKLARTSDPTSGLRLSDLRLSDPDRVLTRLASFISAYAARVPLLELWNGNPALFELMLLLFDRSEFLAEMAIRTPDLIDDVVAGDRLRQRKTAEQDFEGIAPWPGRRRPISLVAALP